MKRAILFLFFLVSAGELASTLIPFEWLHLICKPTIMIALGLHYILSVKEDRSNPILFAILFSGAGDILLMLQQKNDTFFIVGLLSFLISHIFYILGYRQHSYEGSEDGLQGVQKIRFAFPIILAGTGLVVVLYPVLGNLQIPVMAYALVLVVMVLNALFRFGHTNYKSFWKVFTGAVLFMVSDSLLAVTKFLTAVDGGNFWVMLSYISAQYLIVTGLIDHKGKS